MITYQIAFLAFIFGACIGSFLNVCIYRLPMSKSIVSPPSSCPNCGYRLKWYDNIPVLSYMMLRGKCRECARPISIRYPLVEAMAGLFAFTVCLKYGLTIEALIYFTFIAVLLVVTFIDLDHQIIPDVISLPGIPIFLLLSIFFIPEMSWIDALFGIIAGGGSLWLVAFLYELITKKEGMGGGDIKLLAMIGALIGWQGVLFTIFVASIIGTFAGIILMLQASKGMKFAVPFGPFLSMGAIAYIFFGPELIFWYFYYAR